MKPLFFLSGILCAGGALFAQANGQERLTRLHRAAIYFEPNSAGSRFEPSSISCVTGWLRCRERSMPTFFSAATEFSETGSPSRAATPAEITCIDRSGPVSAASACCNKAAAIGLRQMLAVQTTTITPGSDTGRERTRF